MMALIALSISSCVSSHGRYLRSACSSVGTAAPADSGTAAFVCLVARAGVEADADTRVGAGAGVESAWFAVRPDERSH